MKKFFSILSLAVLLLAGCRVEPAVRPDAGEPEFRSVAVSLGADAEEAGPRSRSQLSVDTAEQFNKATLFCFDHATGEIVLSDGVPCVRTTTTKEFSWELPVGKAIDIYAVVNYGEMDLSSFTGNASLTRAALSEALVFTCSSSDFLHLDEAGRGIPMEGILEDRTLSSDDGALTIRVRKLFARYDLYFDLSSWGADFQCVEIKGISSNTEVPFFREGFRQTLSSKLSVLDYGTAEDCTRISCGGADNAVTIYLPENCQGTREQGKRWYEWGTAGLTGTDDLSLCTFIDFEVLEGGGYGQSSGKLYRLYLGTDVGADQRNFDVVRNRKQKVGIRMTGLESACQIEIDAQSAIYLPSTGTVEVPAYTRGFSRAEEIHNLSESVSGVSLSVTGFAPDGSREGYDHRATLRLRTSGAPLGKAFLLTVGNVDLKATDSKNAVVLQEGITFEGENRSYMPGTNLENGHIVLTSTQSFPAGSPALSGLEVAFSRYGTWYGSPMKQYDGTVSFVPSASSPGQYCLQVSIPYSSLLYGYEWRLRGPGRILARARNPQDQYIYFTLGEATVRLCLAVCSYLVGGSGFSRTTNIANSGFVPYNVTQRFLCPGVYCPGNASGHFSFDDYDDEHPDDNGCFHLPFRVDMDPCTIHLTGSYYTVNERGTPSGIGLHVPAAGDGYRRGTSVPVYVYEKMDAGLLESDWYDSDIGDWSLSSVWYGGDNPYPEDLFPYRGLWSLYWTGQAVRHSYTGGSGTAEDGHLYHDIDVINLVGSSGNYEDYYLRVYDWTEGELEDIGDDLRDLYEL